MASAKSWLCHTLVDRTRPILPWEGPPDGRKISPLEASSKILDHIRQAWNYMMARTSEGFDPRLRLENQSILLTVPASFDAVARELTVKAAEMAGLGGVILLEEPQAAFYAWIEAHTDSWRNVVRKDDVVLVCDVGGGTTDFSLIRVTDQEGELALERIAVGDHLLVGGDNIDLALAHTVAARMQGRVDAWQMRSLWHSCRLAKEQLSINPEMASYPITVVGRGSSLIGGTFKATLDASEIERIILSGFFPDCPAAAEPEKPVAAGVQELGLSYAADPAVTRHLAHFLARRRDGAALWPTAVLFNGGVMKSPAVRRRILDVLSAWRRSDQAEAIREIQTFDLDRSVARGAAYYGLVRRGEGIRIRGGLAKSYYIGVAASMPAVPGVPSALKALCVAPFGMEEGTELRLDQQQFVLVVGEPVKFDFLASAIRSEDRAGMVVEDWEQEISPVTTLEATLDGEAGTMVPVRFEIRATEIGTLEIWCTSSDDGRKWKLQFNVREQTA